jgi:hypothetical protein
VTREGTKVPSAGTEVGAMRRDEPAVGSEGWDESGPVTEAVSPVRAHRRRLPFGHGAVLVIGDRAHIVGVADLSVSGAYLRMRLPLRVGDVHTLKLILMPRRAELALRARVVRVNLERDESHEHPRGVAVHFVDVGPDARARLAAFVGHAAAAARRMSG